MVLARWTPRGFTPRAIADASASLTALCMAMRGLATRVVVVA
jgi:hypothetical protein